MQSTPGGAAAEMKEEDKLDQAMGGMSLEELQKETREEWLQQGRASRQKRRAGTGLREWVPDKGRCVQCVLCLRVSAT